MMLPARADDVFGRGLARAAAFEVEHRAERGPHRHDEIHRLPENVSSLIPWGRVDV